MIPTIETIVEDLAAGKITKAQAITWLHQHAEDAGRSMRDDFAGVALMGLISKFPLVVKADLAESAYGYADAMLACRTAQRSTS